MIRAITRIRGNAASEFASGTLDLRPRKQRRLPPEVSIQSPEALAGTRFEARVEYPNRTLKTRFRFVELPGAALLAAILVIVLSVASASCSRRHVRVFVPPPTRPRPPFVPPPQPELPDAPQLDADLEPPTPPESDSAFPVLPPPPPVPLRRPTVIATPKPLPLPAPPEPVPSPRLGQIFTADQSRDYNRTLDESLTRVRMVLAATANRRLTADQDRLIVRIRTFVMQAEQAREQDLVTAVSLARRADLLAQDLAGRLPGGR